MDGTFPAFALDRFASPSSLVCSSLVLVSRSSNPTIRASESTNGFRFKSQPCFSVERPHLYGPSMDRSITPSKPARSISSSKKSSSSSVWMYVVGTTWTLIGFASCFHKSIFTNRLR